MELRAAIEATLDALTVYVRYDEYINGPEGDPTTYRLQHARESIASLRAALAAEPQPITDEQIDATIIDLNLMTKGCTCFELTAPDGTETRIALSHEALAAMTWLRTELETRADSKGSEHG